MPMAARMKLEEMIRMATTPMSVIWLVNSGFASDSKMDISCSGKSMKISVPISMMTQAQIRAVLIQL